MKYIYAEFGDETLVTFNDINRNENGEHIPLYFEQPYEDGFRFLQTVLPDLNIEATEGFSKEAISELISFARDNAPLIWELAREGVEPVA